MIVGICGLAGAGKDTVADFMVKNHGFVKVAMADPMKRFCKEIFDFSDEQLYGPSECRNAPDKRYLHRAQGSLGTSEDLDPENGGFVRVPCPKEDEYLTPRYALQRLGTEYGRDCFQDIWGTYCLRVADKLLHKSGILRSVFYNYTQKEGLYVTNTPERPKPKGVVIPDVRFLNEINNVKKAGGKVIKLIRKTAGLQGIAGQHVSETEQAGISDDVFDHHIINNGNDLALLEAATAGLVEALHVSS